MPPVDIHRPGRSGAAHRRSPSVRTVVLSLAPALLLVGAFRIGLQYLDRFRGSPAGDLLSPVNAGLLGAGIVLAVLGLAMRRPDSDAEGGPGGGADA